jgi:catechol 2,3-dioxygenase-like lactoylglutathione lyase family enzyme
MEGAMSFDHIGFNVADFERSRLFYHSALAPLGLVVVAGGEGWAMIGEPGRGRLWFGAMGAVPGPIHLAFEARTREQVHQFYDAALEAGGRDNGPPGLREYGANYYAAFVIDPDGHNVEAVCRTTE